jgi:hypothetical protein
VPDVGNPHFAFRAMSSRTAALATDATLWCKSGCSPGAATSGKAGFDNGGPTVIHIPTVTPQTAALDASMSALSPAAPAVPELAAAFASLMAPQYLSSTQSRDDELKDDDD